MTELFDDLFILEMANNHQGRVAHGLRIVEAAGVLARRFGIRAAVKFQYRHLDTFIHPDFRHRRDVPHVPRFLETALREDEFLCLVQAVKDAGLVTMCTPFDEPSVERLIDHGIELVKVASCSATDWPLLEKVAASGKPVICSTGGRSLDEVDKVVSFLTHRDVEFALMHCVGLYPTPPARAGLAFIERMSKRYPGVPVGYSGHEAPDDTDIVKIAVAKGARLLERHFGVAADGIMLNAYSLDPDAAARWIEAALAARAICGPADARRHVCEGERASLLSLTRGTYASRRIRQGETLDRSAVFFAMPCASGQTTSGEYQESMVASRDYEPNEAIHERRPVDIVGITRSLIHEAKGLLFEASVEIGRDFSIELSHHYGLQHFRQNGAVIVNVVNREYCKKLIILLPSQKHPSHYHKLKEETFHLLWGDLEVDLNGERRQLKRGDKLLVERLTPHAFSTRRGAVFEEISTAHVVGDSYYEDERIRRKDPIERKTVLESW